MASKAKGAGHLGKTLREGYESDRSYNPETDLTNTRSDGYGFRERSSANMTDTRQQEMDHEEEELTQDEGEQGESKTTRKVSRKRAAPQQKFATPPQPNPMEYVQQFMVSQMALMNRQEVIRREREDKRCEREDKRREDEHAQDAQGRLAKMELDERFANEWREKEHQLATERLVKEEDRLKEETKRRQHERLLRTITKIGPKDDLEAYLENMEHHLTHCKVKEAEWPLFLTANMSGKYLELVQGLTIDPEEDYATLKGRLLEASGFTKRDAGAKHHQVVTKDLVVLTALYFAHFLYGHTFTVFTDHKALVALRTSKVLNRRLQGCTLKLQDFDF